MPGAFKKVLTFWPSFLSLKTLGPQWVLWHILCTTVRSSRRNASQRLTRLQDPMTQLDPNLKPFVKNGLLHHPLVVCVADTDADRNLVNSQYREKKEAIASAIAKQNWPAYIALHERPYRLRALLDAQSKGLHGKEYWQMAIQTGRCGSPFGP
jgi:hypothetical protein